MITLKVKVVPGASRNRVMGMLGDALKVAVAAPPEKGKANQAVIETLAAFFAVPASQVTVTTGHTQPRKLVAIGQLSQVQFEQALEHLTATAERKKMLTP